MGMANQIKELIFLSFYVCVVVAIFIDVLCKIFRRE